MRVPWAGGQGAPPVNQRCPLHRRGTGGAPGRRAPLPLHQPGGGGGGTGVCARLGVPGPCVGRERGRGQPDAFTNAWEKKKKKKKTQPPPPPKKKKNRCEKLVLDGQKMLISFPSFIPTNTCHLGARSQREEVPRRPPTAVAFPGGGAGPPAPPRPPPLRMRSGPYAGGGGRRRGTTGTPRALLIPVSDGKATQQLGRDAERRREARAAPTGR